MSSASLEDFFFLRQGLTMQPKLIFTLNSRSSCLSLPRAGITGLCHHAQLYYKFLNHLHYVRKQSSNQICYLICKKNSELSTLFHYYHKLHSFVYILSSP
jgi:hypothetical protein